MVLSGVSPLPHVPDQYRNQDNAPHVDTHNDIADRVDALIEAMPSPGSVSGGGADIVTVNLYDGVPSGGLAYDGALPFGADNTVAALAMTALQPAGSANAVVDVYLVGPSTGWAKLAKTSATFTVGAHVAVASSGLPFTVRQDDRLTVQIRTPAAGAQLPGNIAMRVLLDPTAVVPVAAAAPASITATVVGTAGGVTVGWAAPAVPAGDTANGFVVTSTLGETWTVSAGATSLALTGLSAAARRFSVHMVTVRAGAGAESALSPSVTPVVAVTITSRLTAAERQGQTWEQFQGGGTVVYDPTFTPAGVPSGTVGNLKFTAVGVEALGGKILDPGRTVNPAVDTSMTVGAVVRNASAHTITVAIWLAYLGAAGWVGDGGYLTFDVTAGQTLPITSGGIAAPGAATSGLLAVQLAYGQQAGDVVNFSGFTWPV